jgi:hypothetical protein
MKYFFLLLFLPAALAGQRAKNATTLPIDLATALTQKLVVVEATGTGGHAGACLKLVCRNQSGRALRLRVPQGQLLEPGDSSMQTLVVAEARIARLDAKKPLELALKTFCAQAGDRSPVAGTAFAVAALAPERVRQLLKFLVDNGKLESPDAQQAVWCVTDGEALGSIGDAALKEFTAGLVGRPAPSYRVRTETRTIRPGDRALPGKALVVEGHYQYVLEKADKLTLVLFDAGGKEIQTLYRDEPAAAGEHRSGLRLQVYNLPPGRYTLKLFTRSKKVVAETEVEW